MANPLQDEPLMVAATLAATGALLTACVIVFGLGLGEAVTEALLALVAVLAPFVSVWLAHDKVIALSTLHRWRDAIEEAIREGEIEKGE